MWSQHERDILAAERSAAWLREAEHRRLTGSLAAPALRETIAAALVACALWLAPSVSAGIRPPSPARRPLGAGR